MDWLCSFSHCLTNNKAGELMLVLIYATFKIGNISNNLARHIELKIQRLLYHFTLSQQLIRFTLIKRKDLNVYMFVILFVINSKKFNPF